MASEKPVGPPRILRTLRSSTRGRAVVEHAPLPEAPPPEPPLRRTVREAILLFDVDPTMPVWMTYQGMERQWRLVKVYHDENGTPDRLKLRRSCIRADGTPSHESCFLFPADAEIEGVQLGW